jgi:hypothetical protein
MKTVSYCIPKDAICISYSPRNLTADEPKSLKKLEAISDELMRGENLQNRQLQT